MMDGLKFGSVALILIVATPLSAIPVAAGPERPPTVQKAVSHWSGEQGTHTLQAARGPRPNGKLLTLAMVGQIDECETIPCLGSALVRKIAHRNFVMDPSLSTAHLEFKGHGKLFTADWTGEDAPETADNDERTRVTREGGVEGTLEDDTLIEGDAWAALREVANKEDNGAPGPLAGTIPHPQALPDRTPPDDALGTNGSKCWNAQDSEKQLTKLMTKARVSRGRSRLKLDPELSQAARKHTQEMIDKDSLHHTTPTALANRVTRWVRLGENVGVGQTVKTLHKAFMNSEVHRANILKKPFRFVGVGFDYDNSERLWVTVIFESRKDPGTTLPMPDCSA